RGQPQCAVGEARRCDHGAPQRERRRRQEDRGGRRAELSQAAGVDLTAALVREPLAVAAAQIASVPGDIPANLRKHLDAIDAARSKGVEVLLFPELSLTGHGGGADALRVALRADDEVVQAIARAAGPLHVTFGLVEEADGA